MFNLLRLLNIPYGYYYYIWVDVLLIKETKKAILIEFDEKTAWLPKVWIIKMLRTSYCERSEAISIKISLYHWTKKFS